VKQSEGVGWMNLAQDWTQWRDFVNTAMKPRLI